MGEGGIDLIILLNIVHFEMISISIRGLYLIHMGIEGLNIISMHV